MAAMGTFFGGFVGDTERGEVLRILTQVKCYMRSMRMSVWIGLCICDVVSVKESKLMKVIRCMRGLCLKQ